MLLTFLITHPYNLERVFLPNSLELVPNRAIYEEVYRAKQGIWLFATKFIIASLPVDGEKEVVDADGDGVPGGGHVTATGGGGSTIAMNSTFCQVQNQSWCVGYKKYKNWKYIWKDKHWTLYTIQGALPITIRIAARLLCFFADFDRLLTVERLVWHILV